MTPWFFCFFSRLNILVSFQFLEVFHSTPILLTPLSNKTASVGSYVNFTCKFLSDLSKFITWTKDGVNGSNATTLQVQE